MADAAIRAASITTSVLSRLASAIYNFPWLLILSSAAHLISLPLRLARLLAAAAFSPLLYVASYLGACLRALAAFLASLQPLYTFFGTAAAVGIIAGIVLAAFSSFLTSHLGMQGNDDDDDDNHVDIQESQRLKAAFAASRDASLSGKNSRYWTDPSPLRRRPAAGLLSQTIMEEEDDSDDF